MTTRRLLLAVFLALAERADLRVFRDAVSRLGQLAECAG
jgi:hypothetical protein